MTRLSELRCSLPQSPGNRRLRSHDAVVDDETEFQFFAWSRRVGEFLAPGDGDAAWIDGPWLRG